MLRASWLFATVVLFPALLLPQGIEPVGFVHPNAQTVAAVPVLAVPPLDRIAIQAEDQNRAAVGLPARYAIPFRVQASPATHGLWEQLDAVWSLWRLVVSAPNASHVNLGFDRFSLPPQARLMLYDVQGTNALRPFDQRDQSPTGDLWTPVVGGDRIVVEVYVPTAARAVVALQLAHVGSGYRFFGAGSDALGLDNSGPCQVDAICSVTDWGRQIPAIAATSSGGSIFCTGFMVNNTAQDQRNYFMTAHHCGVTAGVASSLVVYWNYQNATCGGTGAGFNQFTLGAALRATWSTSDFTLLELNSTPNAAWGISYLGWSRASANATSATGIHHPSGDPKKISFEFQPTQVTSYGGFSQPGDGTHIRVVDWDIGTTEPGSSGSPLFDQNKRVIGQLHGGLSACGLNLSDWYGRFAVSWNGGGTAASRLSNWLDPLNSGAVTLDTLVPVVAAATLVGSGCYNTRASFQQTFAPGAFNLAGTTAAPNVIEFQPTTNGYTVQSGTSDWFAPVAPDLGLGNESLVTLNLPFAFDYPGGSTSVVQMCSNGYVWLDGTSTAIQNTPNFVLLAQGAARFAPLWLDLNPALGGSCHFDVDPSGQAVYLTWADVPALAGGPGNSCQLVLHADRRVEYRYREVPNQPSTCLVGYTRGGTWFPTQTNIATAMPFEVGLDLNPLSWSPVGRPVIGTTQTINLGNIINPAASIGLALIGWVDVPGGLDLGIVGAAGCSLYQQPAVLQPFLVGGTSIPWQLPIPASPSLAGALVFTQGALLTNGVNPLGLLTANGVRLLIGTL